MCIKKITRRSCKHLDAQISGKERITWHEMRQSQQPHHCIVRQWCFYPIRKTCKKWRVTLSSPMAEYSVMRDIHDTRRVSIERGWVALDLCATCKYSNQLNLEQWAFENGLPLFWYALYTCKHPEHYVIKCKPGAQSRLQYRKPGWLWTSKNRVQFILYSLTTSIFQEYFHMIFSGNISTL